MQHARIKLTVAAIALVAAVAYLAVAGAKDGWVYYLDVDAYLNEPTYHEQRVRLAGRVADEGVLTNLLGAEFELLGPQERVPVMYKGVLPDLFKPGCDVVIEGKLGEAGVFQADKMMTKCASKYQAQEHAKRLETGS
jgi:cytochrome c-type biogenesis protein CcmE